MMARLIVRDDADADIDDIAHFIARDNAEAGRRFYDAVSMTSADSSPCHGSGRNVTPATRS